MATTYRFTGQREDDTIGLYFYNARYYDPALGRFVQADTVVPSPGNPTKEPQIGRNTRMGCDLIRGILLIRGSP